jgi:hypothetical protein
MAKPRKWDHLRGQLPRHSDEEIGYDDVVAAAREAHRGLSMEELAESINALEEEKEVAARVVSEKNAKLKALEQLLLTKLEETGVEALRVGGYTFRATTSPSPKIADPVAFRRWIETKSPEVLSVNTQTLKGIVGRALEGDGELPDGLLIGEFTKVSRRK